VSSIEDELVGYMDRHAADTATKARDIQIVAHYYGFDETPWPTLEATAARFGINTRERVRQIIENRFRASATLRNLPRVRSAATLLRSRAFWFTSELQVELSALGEPEDLSLRGLLNLLHDLQGAERYDIYDHNLERVARAAYAPDEDYVVATDEVVKHLRSSLRTARKLPGQLGLSHVSYLSVQIPSRPDRDKVAALLRIDPDAWLSSDDEGDFWYCIETRENTLFTLASKVFATTKMVEINRLAEALCNGLRARSLRYEYPTAQTVAEWLAGSRYFEVEGDQVRFLEAPAILTDIEQAITVYLRRKKVTDFPSLKKHLEAGNFGRAHIDKAVTSSAIVHVDRSGGRGAYAYSLVGVAAQRGPTKPDRYKTMLRRLKAFEDIGTDAPTETKARREQRLLTEWLFAGKSKEDCAICGREFSVRSLVAAHKKRRAECSRVERLDPHIVMPLCLLGCDHLYERGLVWVEAGCLVTSNDATLGAAEKAALKALDRRRLAAPWMKGPAKYFRPPSAK
jgi:hypothetical protein